MGFLSALFLLHSMGFLSVLFRLLPFGFQKVKSNSRYSLLNGRAEQTLVVYNKDNIVVLSRDYWPDSCPLEI